MADTSLPASPAPEKTMSEIRKATYDFCEKTLAKFDAALAAGAVSKGFGITRSQTISGDTVQRTYIIQFDLRLTGCELPVD